MCPNGIGALGCGPQETFRTCSDITIVPLVSRMDEDLISEFEVIEEEDTPERTAKGKQSFGQL